MRLLLFLTLPLYLLDQATKWLVLRFIGTEEFLPVIPGFFHLVQVHNTGAAFGMMSNNNAFFIGLASVALIVLAVLARRGAFADAPTRIGAALLVSGVLGNLTDRLLHGYVVDFLDFHWAFLDGIFHGGHFPAFNVADCAITVGAGLLILDELLRVRRGR